MKPLTINKSVIWFYGRSGSGKTTLSKMLKELIKEPSIILDGDEIRSGLCKDLYFSKADRDENHRRLACIADLLSRQGITTIVASIAPNHSQRDIVNSILKDKVIWILTDSSIETCVNRDTKGLYKKFQSNEVGNSSVYYFDEPKNDEKQIVVNTNSQFEQENFNNLVYKLKETDYQI
jgi:adenylylsulfate kinase